MNFNTKVKKTGVFPLIFREYGGAHPFGSQIPGRQKAAESYRYGFGGHEKVDEVSGTGNTVDMGDRWLDVRLGRTSKLDAKATKYPSLSSYSYAANNPLIVIDPDGKEIRIVTTDPEFRGYIMERLQKLTDHQLSINEEGIVSMTHQLYGPFSKPYGNDLLSQLITSQNVHEIQETAGKNYIRVKNIEEQYNPFGPGSGSLININPKIEVKAIDEDGILRIIPEQIVLGHELIHGSHIDKGRVEGGIADPLGENYDPDLGGAGDPMKNEEINTRRKENILRIEQGVKNLRSKPVMENLGYMLDDVEITVTK